MPRKPGNSSIIMSSLLQSGNLQLYHLALIKKLKPHKYITNFVILFEFYALFVFLVSNSCPSPAVLQALVFRASRQACEVLAKCRHPSLLRIQKGFAKPCYWT
jgi:hypothetical protein